MKRWMVASGSAVTAIALGAWLWATPSAARSEPTPNAGSGATQAEPVELETSLEHVKVLLTRGQRMLTAGTEGTLGLTLVVEPGGAGKEGLVIDAADGPLELHVIAPEGSGLSFGGEGERRAGLNGADVVTVPVPDGTTDRLETSVPYVVDSLVRVRNYTLELNLSVPLTTAAGVAHRDAGFVTLPLRVETPMRTKIVVLIVILIAIFLFVVEWVRVDVVAMMMMVSLPLLGLLSSRATFTGLSSNAVVALIGVMIVSAGLNRVGVVSRLMRPVIRLAGKSGSRLMVSLSGLIALISAVMQNTGAAVLFLPGIRHACKEIKTPISSILMPIGMCAILGGTLTMIGTSPLILLNDILPAGMEKFGLLELTPIGLGFVVFGILYFATVGRFFLKGIVQSQQERRGNANLDETQDVKAFYHDLAGPFEMRVPDDFVSSGRPETIVMIRRERLVNIVASTDARGRRTNAPNPNVKIRSGDRLCAYGPRDKVQEFAEEFGFALLDRPQAFGDLFNPAVAGTVEAIITPRSTMVGSTIREIGFRKTFDVTVLALYREGRVFYREMSDIPLEPGDALLLHSPWEHFHALQATHRNFHIITPLEQEVQRPAKSRIAIVCFAITLTLMLISSFYFQSQPYNPIPLSVCLMLGAVGMIVSGVMSVSDAYHAVDWRTVFLLGGLIPLGMAVDRTGTAEWIASGVVSALGDSVGPLILLTVLAVMSGAFCLVISNVGACTLLVPLGVSMAAQIGMDPRVAAIVVGLGVSNSFLLPTHQVNALYMGPGDYRTKDYMKIGGVMSLIYITVLVAMTYLFYA